MIFENVWKAHLALLHFSKLHFTLFAFSFEILLFEDLYDVVYYFCEVKFEGRARPRGGLVHPWG